MGTVDAKGRVLICSGRACSSGERECAGAIASIADGMAMRGAHNSNRHTKVFKTDEQI